MTLYVMVDGRPKTQPFFIVDGLFRVAVQTVSASLHFHNDKCGAFLGDDVKINMSRLPVALDNLVTFLLKKVGCEILAPLP